MMQRIDRPPLWGSLEPILGRRTPVGPAEWNAVRIVSVMIKGPHDLRGQRLTIQAHVYLGALRPADVRVELLPGRQSCDAMPAPVTRLWTEASFDNGSFLFEGTVSKAATDTAEGFTVCVRPAPSGGAGDQPPVLRWCNANAGRR